MGLLRILSFLLILLFSTSCVSKKRNVKVVACIGDSITLGARLADPAKDSYPAQLQQLLGEAYRVVNLGVGGCTLIRKGKPNVWSELSNIAEINPDLVIVSLGTNDTCGEGTCGDRKCWEFKDSYLVDYLDFIDSLQILPSQPEIWVCAPSPMVVETPGLNVARIEGLTIRKPRLDTLISQVVKVAEEKQIGLIDLNTPLLDHPELFTVEDGVHPNQAGYRVMAELVHQRLKDCR